MSLTFLPKNKTFLILFMFDVYSFYTSFIQFNLPVLLIKALSLNKAINLDILYFKVYSANKVLTSEIVARRLPELDSLV